MFEKTLFGQFFQRLQDLNQQSFQAELLQHRRTSNTERKAKSEDPGGQESSPPRQELIYTNIFFLALWHLVAVLSAVWLIPRASLPLILWGVLIGLLGGLGVTGGAHRLWAHRSYKARLPFKIFMLACFTISGQNSVYDWVRDHRVHHKYSDTDADPHNASRGFFFSHVGWLMMRKHPEVLAKGRTIDMSDIENDPVLAFHRRHFILLKVLLAFVLPSVVPPLLWGDSWGHSILLLCFVRYIALLNITWSVNSAAHLWGNKPYKADIMPSENPLVSLLSMGEGWHNYHHVFPWDYRAAELGPKGGSLTTAVIDLGARLGLVYDRKEPSRQLVERVARRHGDGGWAETEVPPEPADLILDSTTMSETDLGNGKEPSDQEVDRVAQRHGWAGMKELSKPADLKLDSTTAIKKTEALRTSALSQG